MKEYYTIQFWMNCALIVESNLKPIENRPEDISIIVDCLTNRNSYVTSDIKDCVLIMPYELLSNCAIKFNTIKK